MSDYNTEFPASTSMFLKASSFQDQEIPLTYKGWKEKANEDLAKKDGQVIPWKSRVKYCLRYSYPEFAIDEFGEKRTDESGNVMKNKNYDSQYPQGYSIVLMFDEGELETGSLPLWNAFCLIKPKVGELLSISRTGQSRETKWDVKRLAYPKTTQKDNGIVIEDHELKPDEDVVPF